MTNLPTSIENQKVLEEAKIWFKSKIVDRHLVNTEKLKESSKFDINPFVTPYLSSFLTGDITNEGVAKSLVYARVLGTSISTSFGTNIQNFISDVLVSAYGSIVQGIDIVFVDKLDGRTKYAQLKAGPNTINADDVETIDRHFKTIKNLSRTNNAQIMTTDLIVGILYGNESSMSAHYKKLRDELNYPVFVGEEFWHRLTGDKEFMDKLIASITEVVNDIKTSSVLENVIDELSKSEEITKIVQLSKKS